MSKDNTVRVALVHYWLLGMRGGEKVLEEFCRIFPDADIFTLFCNRDALSPELASHRIVTSWLNPLRRWHRSTLPLMPFALEDLDLRGYDLVISSEAGPAKGVLTPAATPHFCYCHSPMRYLWELYPFYRNDLPRNALANLAFSPLASALRLWDHSTASRVDAFVANSRNVRNRIRSVYRRKSKVIYPPVPVEDFHSRNPHDYSLIVSALVPDKRIDYAVRAYSKSGRKLKIAGNGPEFLRLRNLAAPNVEFCGWVPDPELRELYSECSELVVPGEEDFGMTMVEAMASGKPVVALGRGGATEIVTPQSGVLYDTASETDLLAALQTLDRDRPQFSSSAILANAARFSTDEFRQRFTQHVSRMWDREARRNGRIQDIGRLDSLIPRRAASVTFQ